MGSSESTLVKMPYCWKSHVAAQLLIYHSQFCQQLAIMTKLKPSFSQNQGCNQQDLGLLFHLRLLRTVKSAY